MASIQRAFLLTLILICAALFSSAARAECEQRNLGEYFDAVQSNKLEVHFMFSRRKGTGFGGSAYYFTPNDPDTGKPGERMNGDLEGSFDGNAFEATVFWTNQTVGVYTGTISREGRIQGEMFDKFHPNIRGSWHSLLKLPCAKRSEMEGKPPGDVSKPEGPFKSKPRGEVVLAPVAKGFAGIWDTKTGDGVSYTLTLNEQGDGSVGAADPKLSGSLDGTLSAGGNQLTFILVQPAAGITSRGQLTLAAGGDSLTGRITKDSDGKPNSWTGTRRP